ncbi:hypothetical protein NE237_026468 [Protea cynaroides]|uniref:Uncharacterized protein n=1 Tax=Protea cynaroides TaxID=273540 RepID=A0A9Q0K1H9_9MAGN|nr:hypothetical protein NE237_026468 [Protea cynaroides]
MPHVLIDPTLTLIRGNQANALRPISMEITALYRNSDLAANLPPYGLEHLDVIRVSGATTGKHRSVARIDGTECLTMILAASLKKLCISLFHRPNWSISPDPALLVYLRNIVDTFSVLFYSSPGKRIEEKGKNRDLRKLFDTLLRLCGSFDLRLQLESWLEAAVEDEPASSCTT